MKHTDKRFYHERRRVFDRQNVFNGQTSSHGHDPRFADNVICEARSTHAAEMIERALNAREGQMNPIRDRRHAIMLKSRHNILTRVELVVKEIATQPSAMKMRREVLNAISKIRNEIVKPTPKTNS